MKKRGVFIGRILAEVLAFCLLTGCAYCATEQMLPKLETSAEEVASGPVLSASISAEIPEESVEVEIEKSAIRQMQSIPEEGLLGDVIMENPEFDTLLAQGEVVLQLDSSYEEEGLGGLLPGLGQGTWYGIDVDGIAYIYGYYSEIDRTDYFTFIITDEKYELGNGLKVGLSKEEALKMCPELLEVELSVDDMYWNGICYPECWVEQFEYALVVDMENGVDDLPVYLALFMKDDAVVAISPYYPTAG